MSGLLDSLRSASRSLDAQRLGLDVAGQNLANVNTVGYTRRTLQLAELPPTDFYNAGRGVEVVGIYAHRDVFLDARIRREQQGEAFDAAVVDGMTSLEAAIGRPGTSLDAQLTAFFDAFANFANDVRSTAARQDVIAQGQALADGFRAVATALQTSQRDADLTLRGHVNEVNNIAAEVALLNQRIGATIGDTNALQDERGVLLSRLAELTGATVVSRSDGQLDVTIGNGRAIVMGHEAYTIDVTDGAKGLAQLAVGDFNVTAEIAGGRLGGLLHVRDTLVPAHQVRLDQLAYDIATTVNTEHLAGFDLNGNAAGVFFTTPAAVTGAAAALAVDPALAADASLVAGSLTGASGDNQTARAIAALRDANVTAGGTATAHDSWGMFVYHVGADVAQASASAASHEQVVRQLLRLRDDASGVSVDEEAANLMRFQRAYEANARFFTTINDTLTTLMEMVQ